ncbi:letm1 and EF-hand domain-containing protein 1 [Mactra antiquata]
MASAVLRSLQFVPKHNCRKLYPVCCCHHHHLNLNSSENRSVVIFDRRWVHQHSKERILSKYNTPLRIYSPLSISNIHNINHIGLLKNYSPYTIHNSKRLHSCVKYSNVLSTYPDDCIKRSFHLTSTALKEDTVVEKSLKNLKREATKEKPKPKVPVPVPEGRIQKAVNSVMNWIKKSITFLKENGIMGTLKALWRLVLFYKDGTILLVKDIRLCVPLLIKYMRHGNSSLTRREYRLLTQTLRDLLLMIPYLPAILIPFLEFLIPPMIALTGIAPSAFIRKEKKERKLKVKLQMKIESAKLLMESLHNMPLKMRREKDEQDLTVQSFSDFMVKVKSTEVMPPNEDILKFSRLFENSLTLDDLEINQLQGICKLLGIGFLSDIPNARVLRFQIDMRMRELTVDDKFILRDGIDSLTIEELQAANRARGMRALGVSEERLRIQLEQWLELHLKEQVPTSLLLLSRVMYMDENLSPAELLKQTISALPDNLVDKAKVTTAESSGEQIDKKTKIKLLDEEAKAIKKEKEAAEEEVREQERKKEEEKKKQEEQLLQEKERQKQELAEVTLQMMDQQVIVKEVAQRLQERQKMDTKMADQPKEPEIKEKEPVSPPIEKIVKDVKEEEIIEPDATIIVDKAEPIVEKPAEELKDTAEELDDDETITVKDLSDIEKAIEDKALHYKDEMAEVAEDLDEYKEDVEDIKTILEGDQEKKVEERLNAKLLLKRMDKVVKDFDKTINELQDKKVDIQESIDEQEDMLKGVEDTGRDEILQSISEKKSNLISINDVLLSLKQMQTVPDDVRMQKVLEVLDTDHDGLIDINYVLKVTEAVGRENLKLNKAQVTSMMNLIQRENEIEIAEKMKEKEEKGHIKKDEKEIME